MLLDLTISQLDIGPVSPAEAQELGHLGYMQWLGSLPGQSDYRAQAMRAYQRALPFLRHSPAVAVFCDLLVESTGEPLVPLTLYLPPRHRRGGARSRRERL